MMHLCWVSWERVCIGYEQQWQRCVEGFCWWYFSLQQINIMGKAGSSSSKPNCLKFRVSARILAWPQTLQREFSLLQKWTRLCYQLPPFQALTKRTRTSLTRSMTACDGMEFWRTLLPRKKGCASISWTEGNVTSCISNSTGPKNHIRHSSIPLHRSVQLRPQMSKQEGWRIPPVPIVREAKVTRSW